MLICIVAADCEVEAKSYSILGGASCRASWSGYVKLNGVAVWQASFCGNSPQLRGVNILLIDPFTCTKLQSRNFDTCLSASAGRLMGNYVRGANHGVVIVGVTADEPASYLRFGVSALQQLGVNVADVQFRGSFAFVAQQGYPSKTVFDKALTEQESHSEPAQLHVTIEGKLKRKFRYTGSRSPLMRTA